MKTSPTKVACVRSDLKILVMEVEVTPGGSIDYTDAQRRKLNKFTGDMAWEWMYWILKGTSQGSHGEPLKEPFLGLHQAIKSAKE